MYYIYLFNFAGSASSLRGRVVKALGFETRGRGFESRRSRMIFCVFMSFISEISFTVDLLSRHIVLLVISFHRRPFSWRLG